MVGVKKGEQPKRSNSALRWWRHQLDPSSCLVKQASNTATKQSKQNTANITISNHFHIENICLHAVFLTPKFLWEPKEGRLPSPVRWAANVNEICQGRFWAFSHNNFRDLHYTSSSIHKHFYHM